MADQRLRPTVQEIILLMEGLRLNHRRLFSDKHLTHSISLAAFAVLVEDVVGLLRILERVPSMAGMCLEAAFNHMLEAIREPYVHELDRLQDELRSCQLAYQSYRIASETDLARANSEQQAIQVASQTELARVNSEHQAIQVASQAELVKINKEYQSFKVASQAELVRINKEYQSFKVASENEILRVNTEKQATKADLSKANKHYRLSQVELLLANKQYQTAQAELLIVNSMHQKEMAQLRSTIHGLISDKQRMLRERSLGEGTDSIPGSVNRAQTWDKVISKNPGMQNLDIPMLPAGTSASDMTAAHLETVSFGKETEMYDPAFACLRDALTITARDKHPGCTVWDTHARKSLDGHSPDMTLSIGKTNRPDADSAISVWELKPGALDDDGHGQVYDYLKLISKKQRHRSHFFGILSNLKENILITLVREKRESLDGEKNWMWRCRSFKSMTLPYAIAFVRDIITHQHEFLPSMPPFSSALGPMEKRLGSTTSSIVAAFQIPPFVYRQPFARTRWVNQKALSNAALKSFVVKRCVPAHGRTPARSVKSEIKILNRLHKANDKAHPNLPELVYYANDFEEFAIAPWGYTPKPGDPLMNWRQLLSGVLDALKWLHKNRIIHRDVRWDNIICYNDVAVLIDLGASVFVEDETSTTIYGGGNICCPPALIGRFNEPYHPRPADDWYAWLLLVNTLCWPERWRNLRTDDVANGVSEVAMGLESFWKQMAESRMWSRFVEAAETAQPDVLEELLDWCVYFGSPGSNVRSVV